MYVTLLLILLHAHACCYYYYCMLLLLSCDDDDGARVMMVHYINMYHSPIIIALDHRTLVRGMCQGTRNQGRQITHSNQSFYFLGIL